MAWYGIFLLMMWKRKNAVPMPFPDSEKSEPGENKATGETAGCGYGMTAGPDGEWLPQMVSQSVVSQFVWLDYFEPPRFASRKRTFFLTVCNPLALVSLDFRMFCIRARMRHASVEPFSFSSFLHLFSSICRIRMRGNHIPTGSYLSMLKGLCWRGRIRVL